MRQRKPPAKITAEAIRRAIGPATNAAHALERIGVAAAGNNYRRLDRVADENEIDLPFQ